MALPHLLSDDKAVHVNPDGNGLEQQMAVLQSAVEASKDAMEQFQRRLSANLLASEERYRDLFNGVVTGLFRRAHDGRLLLGNPALARMLGFADFEQLSASGHKPALCPPDCQDEVRGLVREWQRADGSALTVRESYRTVRGGAGEFLYQEGTVEEISGGQAVASSFERDCRALFDGVARGEPLNETLAGLVQLVERQGRGRMGCVMLLESGRLYPSAGESLPPGWLSKLWEGVAVGPDTTCCGMAAFRMAPALTENLAESGLWGEHKDLALSLGLRAAWSVPIRSAAGDLLGTFDVYCAGAGHPSAEELQLLDTAAWLAAVAIEHRQLQEKLEQQARTDRLTGLPGRSVFELSLSAALDAADANGSKAAVLWLDLDRFKEINETLGHHTGDEVIRQLARRLAACVPTPGLLARTGGDEFAIVLPEIEGTDAVRTVAERVLSALQAPLQLAGYELFIGASIGICLYPDHGQTAAELQQNADNAMHVAKQRGKNRFVFYESKLSTLSRERLELEIGLRRALERNEFELHYQPQVDLSGNLVGMEALLRWRHATRGVIGPDQFISIAEENGWIVPIGAWAIQEACRQGAAWQRLGYRPIKIAVNVSALQFYFSDLVQVVREALEAANLDPKWLELELTETLVMRDSEQAARALTRLRALGVSVAMDDFGTGYSSLCYLRRLPLDVVKIDRSFLENIESGSTAAIIRAITMLAHSLGLRVVAEGIESDEQMETLRAVGVDLAQGFLIGRPASAAVAEAVLNSYSAAAGRAADTALTRTHKADDVFRFRCLDVQQNPLQRLVLLQSGTV